MTQISLSFWMTLIGTGCWVACFWWMYRISEKQNFLLDQLREQGRRIEKLSKVEHDLIKEVHPQVGEIKEGMEEVIAAVKENAGSIQTEKMDEMIAAVKENTESNQTVKLEEMMAAVKENTESNQAEAKARKA